MWFDPGKEYSGFSLAAGKSTPLIGRIVIAIQRNKRYADQCEMLFHRIGSQSNVKLTPEYTGVGYFAAFELWFGPLNSEFGVMICYFVSWKLFGNNSKNCLLNKC